MATEAGRLLPELFTGSQIVYCMAFTHVMEMVSGLSTHYPCYRNFYDSIVLKKHILLLFCISWVAKKTWHSKYAIGSCFPSLFLIRFYITSFNDFYLL